MSFVYCTVPAHNRDRWWYLLILLLLQIDFVGMQIRSVAEQRRAEDENRRKQAMEREKISTALAEMEGSTFEIVCR